MSDYDYLRPMPELESPSVTQGPKLLTEAEARAIYLATTSPEDFNRRLNERGLIVPEPVDPLLIKAREGDGS